MVPAVQKGRGVLNDPSGFTKAVSSLAGLMAELRHTVSQAVEQSTIAEWPEDPEERRLLTSVFDHARHTVECIDQVDLAPLRRVAEGYRDYVETTNRLEELAGG